MSLAKGQYDDRPQSEETSIRIKYGLPVLVLIEGHFGIKVSDQANVFMPKQVKVPYLHLNLDQYSY
jgi:hypothetical protein